MCYGEVCKACCGKYMFVFVSDQWTGWECYAVMG